MVMGGAAAEAVSEEGFEEQNDRREQPSLKKDLENLVVSLEKEAASILRLAPRLIRGYSREAFFGNGKTIEVSRDVDEDKPPIVFLYGYASNRRINRVSDYLADLGYRVYEIVTPFMQRIEKQAKIAEKHIKEIYDKHKEPLVLIGHSMGGLVGKYYLLEKHGTEVRSCISLATPHLGTLPARIVPGQSGEQMRLASRFTQNLWKKHLHDYIETTAFVPTYDYVVFPPNLMPDGINILLPRENHVMIVDSMLTAEWIDFVINNYRIVESRAEHRKFRPSLGMRLLDRLPYKPQDLRTFEELMSKDFMIALPSVLRKTEEAKPYSL